MKCGQAYVIDLDGKNTFIEVGDVFLPNENAYWTRPYRFEDFGDISDLNKRVITVSTMIGCYFNCQFCSVKKNYTRNLSLEEILGQVEFSIETGLRYGRSSSPNESKEFHVLFTRMGEPGANIENVIETIKLLAKKYQHVKIGLSTNGWEDGAIELLKHPEIAPYIMMQMSMHGTDDKTRSKMLGITINEKSRLMDIPRIAKFVKEFRILNPRKVSLNFIFLKGEKYDFTGLRKYFDIEDIYIRMSPLNITDNSNELWMVWLIREDDVLEKAAQSSQELKEIIENIEQSGFAYAYAPAIDEEIKYQAACGQALEMVRSKIDRAKVWLRK